MLFVNLQFVEQKPFVCICNIIVSNKINAFYINMYLYFVLNIVDESGLFFT